MTPNSRDVVTIDSPGAGENRVGGTSGGAGGVVWEAVSFWNVSHVLVDTGRNDGPGPDDTVTFTSDLVATGLQSFTVNTGPGNDTVNAAIVASLGVTVLGGDGDDSLTGGAGSDRLEGGAGQDVLDGGAGVNTLLGGADSDIITAGAGGTVDTVDGGTGDDVVNFNDGEGDYTVSGFVSTLVRVARSTGSIALLTDVEELNVGPPTNPSPSTYDVLDQSDTSLRVLNIAAFRYPGIVFFGRPLAVTIQGTVADDRLDVAARSVGFVATLPWGLVQAANRPGTLSVLGLEGNDTIKAGDLGATVVQLVGGAGNDRLEGSTAVDSYDGGDGDDVLVFAGGADTMVGGPGFDVIQVNGTGLSESIVFSQIGSVITVLGPVSGTFDVTGSNSVERLDVFGLGGNDNITVSGVTMAKNLDGGAGNDTVDCSGSSAFVECTILGGDDSDTLTGSPGADSIHGGPGNDTITGGPGSDDLSGDADSDTFTWNPGDGSDTVEGGTGVDSLVFNGSVAAETFTVSPFGARTTLTRNVGAITMSIGDTEQVVVAGVAGDDIFYVAPQPSTAVSISGGDPPAPATPGDRLAVVLAGATSPSLTPGSTGAGIWSFANRQSVHFDGIEETAAGFTDQTIQFVTIKVEHVHELRSRINALRARFFVGPFLWTDNPLVSGVTPIRAVHIAELRTALQAAYVAAGRTPPSYTDDPLTPGATVVQAAHVEELRNAVIALE